MGFDLDKFGEMMDETIHKSCVAMVVSKGPESDEWHVQGQKSAGMNLYIFLNALKPIYRAMLAEFRKIGAVEFEREKLAEALGDLLVSELKEAGDDEAD